MKNVLAYAQLLRIPNVFTTFADIGIGAAAVIASGAVPSFCLFLASACLYCGGMVWNDYFDVAEDTRDRPFRPIPSGRVSLATARWLGFGLLISGLVFATLSGWHADLFDWMPGDIAGCLVAMIVAYDAWLKHTWAGPLAMGSCRALNVLLGWSAAVAAGWEWWFGISAAVYIGFYILGVTWFARTEAIVSNRKTLTLAAVVMLVCVAGVCSTIENRVNNGDLYLDQLYYVGSTFALALYMVFLIGLPIRAAIRHPIPASVQKAVKRSIFGLIVLDTMFATGLVGPPGLVLLLLLPLGLLAGQWVYST